MRENRPRRKGRNTAARIPSRQPDYRHLCHPFSPQSVFSEDEVHSLHDTALRVLQELGMKILLPEARDIFAAAGARVDGEMVYIGSGIVKAALQSAPSSIRLRAGNPDRDQTYEEGTLLFMAGAGCPNVTDRERGRRPGSREAFRESLKLCQSFDVIHMLGPNTEPQDVPIQNRHYAMMEDQFALSDKLVFIYSRGSAQVHDCFEMIQLARDLTAEAFDQDVWCYTIINTNSPRMLDKPMAQGIIDFARAGQMSIITPFCLAGAMAPITVAGALTLQHAEALASIALAQLTRKGAPVSYGGFSSNVDMKSGAPAFGTPEHMKMQIGAGQLARHIGLPWRSASGSASNTADMQSANETTMALWGGLMANATVLIHAAGWLEGGLTFGYEKFINDVEALQTLAEMCVMPTATEAEIGYEALKDVEPGGHFFATRHTMDRYEDAFYAPLVADLSNFGTWEAAGAQRSDQRAKAIWKQVLNDFKPPASAAGTKERLASFIERRIVEGGAPPLD